MRAQNAASEPHLEQGMRTCIPFARERNAGVNDVQSAHRRDQAARGGDLGAVMRPNRAAETPATHTNFAPDRPAKECEAGMRQNGPETHPAGRLFGLEGVDFVVSASGSR